MTWEAAWRQLEVAESEGRSERETAEAVVVSRSRDWMVGSLAGEKAEETWEQLQHPPTTPGA